MAYRMNGQYILEGISGAMMYTLGGARVVVVVQQDCGGERGVDVCLAAACKGCSRHRAHTAPS
jgi:hypothetical protein